MRGKPKIENEKFLSKMQEVSYQKEFRRADKTYNQLTQKGNRS
ncbi:YfhE family protein [Virgibacillus doumboii]|nr:YfhE family protein [Virgibacillus doumboii]